LDTVWALGKIENENDATRGVHEALVVSDEMLRDSTTEFEGGYQSAAA
jgi:hypothetical protein